MNTDEKAAVADQFGVATEQVERDHLISHLLAFLSLDFGDRIHFIGGTALARTHGRLTLDPALSSVRDTHPAILRTSDGLTVRLQLLSPRDRIVWPTERRSLVQRYSDAPAAELLVPTRPAFAASKTATWFDRHASRDLWDLWALDRIGAIDAEAENLYRRFGPTNNPPALRDFKTAPTEADWQSQLAGQTRLTVSPKDALTAVHDAWAQVIAASASGPRPASTKNERGVGKKWS